MFNKNRGVPDFSFITDFGKNTNRKKLKIRAIQGITGLEDIEEAFDNSLNKFEVKLLVNFLDKKYNFSLFEEPYDFILNVAKFSPIALECINANFKHFYDNMTISESLEVILDKLINDDIFSDVN